MEPSRNRVVVPARQATQPGGFGSLESILGLLNSFKIRAPVNWCVNTFWIAILYEDLSIFPHRCCSAKSLGLGEIRLRDRLASALTLTYDYALNLQVHQEVTQRCRLSMLTNSALVYEPKMRGKGGIAGSLTNEYSCTQ